MDPESPHPEKFCHLDFALDGAFWSILTCIRLDLGTSASVFGLLGVKRLDRLRPGTPATTSAVSLGPALSWALCIVRLTLTPPSLF